MKTIIKKEMMMRLLIGESNKNLKKKLTKRINLKTMIAIFLLMIMIKAIGTKKMMTKYKIKSL